MKVIENHRTCSENYERIGDDANS